MTRLAPPVRRRLAAGAALTVFLAGCSAELPASLLLTITGGPGAPAPETIQVRTFDDSGPLQVFTSFPAPPPQADGQLGTVVIYPARGDGGWLRVHAHGLRQGIAVSEGTARAQVAPGRQATATLTLAATAAADGDADGVPDEIDNCPAVVNARQEDANRDGQGDACSGGEPPTVAALRDAGAPADAAVPADAAAGCCDVKSAPDLRPLGAACATGSECGSGFCTDGVCCGTGDCGGPCRACNLGTAGACQPRPAGTACGPGRCREAMETAESTCSADGACRPGRTRACADSFACKGDQCATSCATELECTAQTYCVSGACKPRSAAGSTCKDGRECATGFCADGHCCVAARCAQGAWCGGPGGSCLNKRFVGDPAPCDQHYQCNSGFCVDGVCCESACNESCQQCADPAMIGRCVPLAAGTDSNAASPCTAPKRCQAGACR